MLWNDDSTIHPKNSWINERIHRDENHILSCRLNSGFNPNMWFLWSGGFLKIRLPPHHPWNKPSSYWGTPIGHLQVNPLSPLKKIPPPFSACSGENMCLAFAKFWWWLLPGLWGCRLVTNFDGWIGMDCYKMFWPRLLVHDVWVGRRIGDGTQLFTALQQQESVKLLPQTVYELWRSEELRRCDESREEVRKGEKRWEEVRSIEKRWEELSRVEKRREKLSRGEKRWEDVRRIKKRQEELRNVLKSWQELRRAERRWENVRRAEKNKKKDVTRVGKNFSQTCALRFFPSWPQWTTAGTFGYPPCADSTGISTEYKIV